MTNDPILASFLERQQIEAEALAAESDLLDLAALGPAPVSRYLARFTCRGLVTQSGQVKTAERFEIGIRFPSDYLRRIEVAEVLTWLSPVNAFHPNIAFPFICPGHLSPGTALCDILLQCFEIIVWRKVQMREDDCLNRAACGWARAHRASFPVDPRPLRRRVAAMTFAEAGRARGSSS